MFAIHMTLCERDYERHQLAPTFLFTPPQTSAVGAVATGRYRLTTGAPSENPIQENSFHHLTSVRGQKSALASLEEFRQFQCLLWNQKR
jgi:hypothetical protein